MVIEVYINSISNNSRTSISGNVSIALLISELCAELVNVVVYSYGHTLNEWYPCSSDYWTISSK